MKTPRKLLTLAACVGLLGTAQAQFDDLQNYGDARTDGGSPGSFVESPSGVFSITAGGGDFWGNSDNGAFLTASDGSLTTTTDFTASVRHVGTTDPSTNDWGREPLMMRAQAASGAPFDPANPANDNANAANFALHRTSSGNGLGNPGLVTGWRDNPGGGYGDNRNTVPGVGALDEVPVFMAIGRNGADLATGFAGDISFGASPGIPGRWIGTHVRTHPNIGVGSEVTVGVGHQSHNAITGGGNGQNTATYDSFNFDNGNFDPALFGPAPAGDYLVFGSLAGVDRLGKVWGSAGTFENGAATGEPTGWKISAQNFELVAGANANGSTIIPNVDWTGNNGTSATNPAPYNVGQQGDFTVAVAGFSATNQDNYGVHMTGEIFIPADGDRLNGDIVSFKDGIDDYTYLLIDGQELINDNAWTGYDGVANGGSPIVQFDASDPKYDDGEWVAFEMIMWEGGGGDAGVLYWDQNAAGGFPAAQADAATTDAVVPATNFRQPGGGDPGLVADIYLSGNPGNLGAARDRIAPGRVVTDSFVVTGTSPVGDIPPNGIRAEIQAAIDSGDPELNQNTHPDTQIQEGDTPNPGQNDNYRLAARGTFIVDNANGTPGETLDLTFTIRNDDGGQLHIFGQSFTGVAGDGRTFIEDIGGDGALTADFFTGNTNALGQISLIEGTYQFDSYMFEGGGGSRHEIQAALGTKTGFDGDFFVIDGGTNPVRLSGPVDVYKLNGPTGADPGGGEGASPSRFSGVGGSANPVGQFPGVCIPAGEWDEVSLMVVNTGGAANDALQNVVLPPMEVYCVTPGPGYWQDFDGFADGTTDLGDGSQMNGTANVQGGQLELTRDGVAGGFASFNIPAIPGAANGWTATFDLTIIDSPAANPPADGMSFNWGNFALGELGTAEDGMQGAAGVTENISFEIDTWMNFDAEQGVNIAEKVGGATNELAFTNGPILDDGTTVSGQVTMSWDPVNGASFTTTGLLTNANFTNIPTTFAASDDLLFGLSGRVGGANETKLIDNLHIETMSTATQVNSIGSTPAGLLAYFNFDGQSENQAGPAPDAALAGPAVIGAGGTGFSGGAGDGSLDLGGAGNGAAAVVPAGSHFDSAFNNNAMAVSLWQFNTQIANSSTFWVHSPAAGANDRGFQAHIPWGNGTVFFDQSGCCAGPQRLTVGGVVNLNQWQHFVFQRDADGNREIWVDGVKVAMAGGAEALDAFNGLLTIGAEGNNLNNGFSGRVDDLAVWDRALSPGEIAALSGGAATLDIGSLLIDYGKTGPGDPIVKDFTVVNTNNVDLNITGVEIPDGFSLIAASPAPIPPGGSIDAQIQFDADGPSGIYGGNVIISTDTFGAPFEFEIVACLDASPPEFTSFPGKTFLVADAGAVGATGTWDDPVAEDDNDPDPVVTQTGGPAQGTLFPIGVTEISYSATDAWGNTITAGFDVVVSLNPDDALQIATNGEAAPGSDGLSFNGFDGGYIAGPGHVILKATARNTSELGAAGAVQGSWRTNVNDGGLGLIGLQGATTPPDASGTIDSFLRCFIAKDGKAAYRSRTSGGGEGHWSDVGGTASAIAVLGGPALGSTYDKFAAAGQALTNDGEHLYLARVARGAGGVTKFNDWAIWSDWNGLQIRKGDGVPAVAGATYLDFEPQIAGNSSGDLVFSAAMRGGSIVNGVDNRALFAGPASGPAIVAQKGSAEAGGSGATYNQFSCEAINGDGEVAFGATLIGTGTTVDNNTALYTNIGDSVSQILREGDPALGFDAGEVYDSFGDVYICDDGSVWVKASARGPLLTATSNDAVYVWREGSLTLIAREGDTAPGTAGVLRALSKLTSTRCCHAAFSGILQRGVGGVTRRNSDAVWFVPAGTTSAVVLVRGGDTYVIGEEEETVQRPDILQTEDDGTGGRSSALGAGNVIVTLSYSNGSKEGVFLLGLQDGAK